MLEMPLAEFKAMNRELRRTIPGWPWLPLSRRLAREIARDEAEERRAGAERQRAYRARQAGDGASLASPDPRSCALCNRMRPIPDVGAENGRS